MTEVRPTPASPQAAREDRRQRAVESLAISAGESQPRLDRIVRLAQTFFRVPTVSITVLDRDNAWFAGSVGLEVTEVPRVETFCDHTTAADAVTVVEDARADERFSSLPLVARDGVSFYAGAPLRDGQGNVVATFCLFDTEPRHLDGEQMATFLDMATWAQQELVDSAEMAQAGAVQAAMLPASAASAPGWELDGVCVPALAVGGDFYDFSIDQGVAHLAIGDVMGKGTGAALLGAGIRAALRGTLSAVTAGVDLGVTVTQLAASQLADLERNGSFVTLFQAAIDTEDGRIRYVDAGAGLALLVHADGSIEQLRGQDRPLGILPDDHWTEHERYLDPGDRVLVFSDGILDLLDDQENWVAEIGALAAQHPTVPGLLGAVRRLTWSRTPLDDVTAVVVDSHRAEALP